MQNGPWTVIIYPFTRTFKAPQIMHLIHTHRHTPMVADAMKHTAHPIGILG